MTIYEQAIEKVEQGARFSVDLKTKTLKVNRTKLIDNGNYKGELINFTDDVLEFIRTLYSVYKISVPSERNQKHRHTWKAKPFEELSDKDLIYGESRELAQAELEMFVLCAILSGQLTYQNGDKWFWKPFDDEPDFILLKSWFE